MLNNFSKLTEKFALSNKSQGQLKASKVTSRALTEEGRHKPLPSNSVPSMSIASSFTSCALSRSRLPSNTLVPEQGNKPQLVV